jgi:hypothetical protein
MDKTKLTTRRWIAWGKDAGERAVKTVAQTAVALLSTDSLGLIDFASADLWSASLAAGLLSLLTSVAAKRSGSPASARIGG